MTVLTLAAEQPFDPAPTLGALAAHAVPGTAVVDPAAGRCARVLTTSAGPVGVRVELDTAGAVVHPGADLPPSARDELVAAVRFWLDLGPEAAHAVAALADDDVVGPLVRARPGVRVVREPDGFAAVVGAVVGQQVSVARARTLLGRLVAACDGPACEVPGVGRLRAFPDAATVARTDEELLRATMGLTGARGRSVHAVARAVADGLHLDRRTDPAWARDVLLRLPGVGPWTTEVVALRALGDDDAYPAGDLVLRRALGDVTTAVSQRVAAAWSPWRGRAATHLWVERVYAP